MYAGLSAHAVVLRVDSFVITWHAQHVACTAHGMHSTWHAQHVRHAQHVACAARGMRSTWHAQHVACTARGMHSTYGTRTPFDAPGRRDEGAPGRWGAAYGWGGRRPRNSPGSPLPNGDSSFRISAHHQRTLITSYASRAFTGRTAAPGDTPGLWPSERHPVPSDGWLVDSQSGRAIARHRRCRSVTAP